MSGQKNLCLAGGVALNCVANGRILREGPFEEIWIQPAAGDAGASVGTALAVNYLEDEGLERNPNKFRDSMRGSYLGPSYSNDEIRAALGAHGATFEELNEATLLDVAAEALANRKSLGWFQGRMEFGPRALGNRSILADPRSPEMQKILNMKIKYRESFRPFAPAILREDLSEYFDLDYESPYMLLVADVAKKHHSKISKKERQADGLDKLGIVRSNIPAVTHVDYSSRIQTVSEDTNPLFHKLIKTFKEKTGCPILVNTSFNVRDEPIVCSPTDAYSCFMGTEMYAHYRKFLFAKHNQ